MLYAILILALVVLDQVVKFLVRAHIPLGGSLPFLPHILALFCFGRAVGESDTWGN